MANVQRYYTHAAIFLTAQSDDQDTFVKTSDYRELERQLAEARKVAEIADAQLHRISQWCEAYPLDVFPKPDMKEVQRLLGDTLLTQLSSHNMRHVVEGVAKIIKRPKEKP